MFSISDLPLPPLAAVLGSGTVWRQQQLSQIISKAHKREARPFATASLLLLVLIRSCTCLLRSKSMGMAQCMRRHQRAKNEALLAGYEVSWLLQDFKTNTGHGKLLLDDSLYPEAYATNVNEQVRMP